MTESKHCQVILYIGMLSGKFYVCEKNLNKLNFTIHCTDLYKCEVQCSFKPRFNLSRLALTRAKSKAYLYMLLKVGGSSSKDLRKSSRLCSFSTLSHLL